MNKILVTGGTGYIGSHTVVELLKTGNYDVDIVDNLANSKDTVIDDIEKITGIRPNFYHFDLLDETKLRDLFRENDYKAVIHFAGLKAVGESVEQPLRYYENNLLSTLNILKCMKEFNVNEIIFSSSATVYGDRDNVALTEDMQTGIGITNPYGRTKFMIEEILKDFCKADETKQAVILRYFNPIGNHESGLIGEDPNGIPNNLMPIIMRVSQGRIPELSIYGDDYDTPDGTCIRDYIHVVDLAKGHLAALEKVTKTGISIYNLGTGKGTSVKEMVAAFEEASGKSLPHKVAGRRAGDLPSIFANVDKAEKELDWKATRTVADAMRDTMKFLNKEQ
ncbi:UDP-glucose 4-epimerase GalE [Candidatus Saccharibacteria bacterium]|nr:UDP-glucose 4-epimerase GalE [Candidatus Saccharibacteria bacterium]